MTASPLPGTTPAAPRLRQALAEVRQPYVVDSPPVPYGPFPWPHVTIAYTRDMGWPVNVSGVLGPMSPDAAIDLGRRLMDAGREATKR